MNEAEVQLMASLEEDHWWFRGKRMLVAALLSRCAPPRRLVDLGCGSGGVLDRLPDATLRVGVDRSASAVQMCRARGGLQAVRGDLTNPPLSPGHFDLVLALDVIEHLDDDVAFLRSVRSLVRPEGRMLVAVPAFPFLWSRHDETFEHRRRYSREGLETALRAAGLVPEFTTFTNTLLFPAAAVWRILFTRTPLRRLAPGNDFVAMPRWLNRILTSIYRLEARLVRRVPLPFGLSVACIARLDPEFAKDEDAGQLASG